MIATLSDGDSLYKAYHLHQRRHRGYFRPSQSQPLECTAGYHSDCPVESQTRSIIDIQQYNHSQRWLHTHACRDAHIGSITET